VILIVKHEQSINIKSEMKENRFFNEIKISCFYYTGRFFDGLDDEKKNTFFIV